MLTTGRITLPVPEPDRAYLRSIRRGERPLAEVFDCVDGLDILEGDRQLHGSARP